MLTIPPRDQKTVDFVERVLGWRRLTGEEEIFGYYRSRKWTMPEGPEICTGVVWVRDDHPTIMACLQCGTLPDVGYHMEDFAWRALTAMRSKPDDVRARFHELLVSRIQDLGPRTIIECATEACA